MIYLGRLRQAIAGRLPVPASWLHIVCCTRLERFVGSHGECQSTALCALTSQYAGDSAVDCCTHCFDSPGSA